MQVSPSVSPSGRRSSQAPQVEVRLVSNRYRSLGTAGCGKARVTLAAASQASQSKLAENGSMAPRLQLCPPRAKGAVCLPAYARCRRRHRLAWLRGRVNMMARLVDVVAHAPYDQPISRDWVKSPSRFVARPWLVSTQYRGSLSTTKSTHCRCSRQGRVALSPMARNIT